MNSQTISANKYKYITQIGTPLKDGRQKKHIIKATITTAVCHINLRCHQFSLGTTATGVFRQGCCTTIVHDQGQHKDHCPVA
jgi:hypothetical protein